MITLEQALEQAFSLVSPLGTEQVDLANAHGRVLAIDAVAGARSTALPRRGYGRVCRVWAGEFV